MSDFMQHFSSQKRGKALVVIPYFGRFGPWFPLFLESLSRQEMLDLLLVTDAETPPLPANARRVEMTLGELRARAEEALQARVRLERPYKLCDLKPAYGLVFAEFLQDYDYWAFGDEDVFYGPLDRMLAPRLTQQPDLVVPNYRMTIGHFTLVRNTSRLNRLVLEDSNYLDILADEANWRYDEAGCSESHPSFTRTVKALEARGELAVNWGLPIQGNVPGVGKFVTYDGTSLHNSRGTELAYYHWGRLRQRNWRFPSVEEARRGFVVDSLGFCPYDLGTPRRVGRWLQGVGAGVIRKGLRDLGGQSSF